MLFKGNYITMKSNTVEKFKHDSSLADMDLRQKKKSRFRWIGGLAEFREEYTSVELQEKVSDWIVESSLGRPIKKLEKPAEVLN